MSSVGYVRERTLLGGLLWRMEPEAQERWEANKSSHRFMTFKGKQLVLFTLDTEDKPVLKDKLTMQAISLSDTAGITSTWTTADHKVVQIGHIPVEVAPSIFLWHTYTSDVQYTPHKGVYNIKASMLFKTPHNISHKHMGPVYMLEVAAFQQEFPA
jgi:hypothetical protein